MANSTRSQITIIGSQQHGKTFWSEKYAEYYAQRNGNVLVYNYGRSTDYEGFEEITVLNFQRHKEITNSDKYNGREVFLFAYNGKVYHFRDFNKLFSHKKLRIKRIRDLALERGFFDAVFNYIHSTLIIKDDVRAIFRHGLQAEAINLFSRRDHTGEFSSRKGKNGVDIILQFHSADSIPEETYIYFTALICFRCIDLPKLHKVVNETLKKTMFETFRELQNPKFPKWEARFIDLSASNYCAKKDATYR